jgi:hypothetical protein
VIQNNMELVVDWFLLRPWLVEAISTNTARGYIEDSTTLSKMIYEPKSISGVLEAEDRAS